MIDMHHFHRARDRVEDLDALPQEWFHFAHLCDAPSRIPTDLEEMIHILRDARLYVGEGGIDVASIVEHLPPVVFSIELPNVERAQEMGYAEHAFRCIESAKRYFAAHPRPRASRGRSRRRSAPGWRERSGERV
jgi:sugar phosphate isomerase/epimerase